jgi:hypothetical protein
MKVIVFVKATADSEKGTDFSSPDMQALMAEMGRFNDELEKAGILNPQECAGLKPTSAGKRIAFNGKDRAVIEGPFNPAGDQVAGYWLWTVKDMDEAVAWAKRCPNPMPGPSELEIRPLYEEADFAS